MCVKYISDIKREKIDIRKIGLFCDSEFFILVTSYKFHLVFALLEEI